MFDKIKILLHTAFVAIFEKFLSRKSLFIKPGTMVIVRLDGIGDYILFRNFIRSIKESEKYKDYKITLFGNSLWKNLGETFDKKYIDNFIWADTKMFQRKAEWVYRYSQMFKLHNAGFETLILPNDTLNKLTEFIIKYSGAKNKIVKDSDSLFFYNGCDSNLRNSEKSFIRNSVKEIFQFYRNKDFIENITGTGTDFDKPSFELSPENFQEKLKEEYVVVFPGAGYEKRKWSAENFAGICKKISEVKNIKIIICGDITDKEISRQIIQRAGIQNITDLTGETSLSELVKIISNAKLLISNETCAVHIGAAVNTRTICISNGNHYGRFNPYPEEITTLVTTLYPPELENKPENFDFLVKKFHISSDLDINKISAEEVFENVMELINIEKEKV